MPRFYFHILDRGRRAVDDEGEEFPDLDTARKEAKLSAIDLLIEAMKSGYAADARSLEIADENGRVLETKTLREYAGMIAR